MGPEKLSVHNRDPGLEPSYRSMVLRVVNPKKAEKDLNVKNLKKRNDVYKKRIPKKESSQLVTPLCRSIDTLKGKSQKSKIQVGFLFFKACHWLLHTNKMHNRII